MSRIAYLISNSVKDAMKSATEFGWQVVSATRYAGPDKQDIRLATTPGDMICQERPTDVYRDGTWFELVERWPQVYVDEINRMIDADVIVFANDVEDPNKADAS